MSEQAGVTRLHPAPRLRVPGCRPSRGLSSGSSAGCSAHPPTPCGSRCPPASPLPSRASAGVALVPTSPLPPARAYSAEVLGGSHHPPRDQAHQLLPVRFDPPPHRLAGRAGEGSMRWDVCPVSSASHTVLMTLLHLGRASGHGERRSLTGSGRRDLWALPADVPSSTRDRVSPGTGRLGVARAQATSAVGHLRRGPPPCRAVRPASWCGPPHI